MVTQFLHKSWPWYIFYREENWSGKGKNGTEASAEGDNERAGDYDGPPGMDPDGVIESNWDKVQALYSWYLSEELRQITQFLSLRQLPVTAVIDKFIGHLK